LSEVIILAFDLPMIKPYFPPIASALKIQTRKQPLKLLEEGKERL